MTPKQLAYVGARLNGLKGRAAAIQAGYSPSGADVTAAKLNRDPKIKNAIARGRRAGSDRDHMESMVGVDDKEKPRLKPNYATSLDLLRGVYNNPRMADGVRIDAAKAALPFEHGRIVDTGKKQKKVDAAKEIAAGGKGAGSKPKFATKAPPRLRSIQGGKSS
jgi:phage terminase small subunit